MNQKEKRGGGVKRICFNYKKKIFKLLYPKLNQFQQPPKNVNNPKRDMHWKKTSLSTSHVSVIKSIQSLQSQAKEKTDIFFQLSYNQ